MNSDLSILITIGKRAYAEKDLRQAEKTLREAITGGANYPDIHYILGLIYHQWGKLEEAVREFESSISLNPEYTEALLSLSITLGELGRYEDARAAHKKAADSITRPGMVMPGNQPAGMIANLHAELGALYLALGKTEDAIAEYRKSLSVAPGFPDLRIRLAIALREAGRLEEGLAELEKTIADRPGLVSAHAQQGVILYLLGRKEEAQESWEKALYRDPRNKLVQLYLNALERELGSG
ncbi:MAG: tetratricopeptide repeat protein [Deltaproteobacteria bacterium]|nr:tetratricopeptide repeat protein [Deltaproteobacteria bacterium]